MDNSKKQTTWSNLGEVRSFLLGRGLAYGCFAFWMPCCKRLGLVAALGLMSEPTQWTSWFAWYLPVDIKLANNENTKSVQRHGRVWCVKFGEGIVDNRL